MKVILLYGSNTGNTQELAKFLKEQAGLLRVNLKLRNVADKEVLAHPKEFLKFDLTILACSTWGGFEPKMQEDCANFWQHMPLSEVANRCFAVVGLGDRYYLNFCKAVDFIVDDLGQNGAQIVGRPLMINDPWEHSKGVAQSWLQEIFHEYSVLKKAKL